MKIDTMRRIDRFLGPVILFVFSCFHLIYKLFSLPYRWIRPASDKTIIRNIYISKYFGIGSILLATPLLRNLKKKYPDAKILLLTFSPNVSLADKIGYVDEVISFSDKNLFAFTGSILKFLLRHIRKPDVFIDLEFFSNFPLIVMCLSMARVRAGFYERQLLRRILLDKKTYFNYRRHLTEIYLNAGSFLGIDAGDNKLEKLKTPGRLSSNYLKYLKNYDSQSQKFIVINPNSSDLSKLRMWPKENYIWLIDNLLKDPRFFVVSIGGRDDGAYTDTITASFSDADNFCNLCGKTTIPELVNLLSNADILIANDSGPLHIAVAQGVKTISFFGPETPDLYGPLDKSIHKVFYVPLYCSPCLTVLYNKLSKCKVNRCLKEIQKENVYRAVYESLNLEVEEKP